MPKLTETQMIEKIVRAKVKLEGMRRNHTPKCATETSDPEEHRAPECTCGASAINSAVESVLAELSLE